MRDRWWESELASVHAKKLVPHSCLVPFQLDTAMESSDVDERVGRSEGFPYRVPILVVVVIHVFIVIHLGLIRRSERFFHVHADFFQPLQIFVDHRAPASPVPRARNEVDNDPDGFILLHSPFSTCSRRAFGGRISR